VERLAEDEEGAAAGGGAVPSFLSAEVVVRAKFPKPPAPPVVALESLEAVDEERPKPMVFESAALESLAVSVDLAPNPVRKIRLRRRGREYRRKVQRE
jgi:hypothetical protein